MKDLFLKDNGNFTNYGWEHGMAFILCIVFIAGVLYFGHHRWNEDKKYKYIVWLTIFGASTQLFKVFYRLYSGVFDIADDLPLHLCNLMTIVMPFIMIFRLKKLWGITFFWILAGCAQSIFTTTLTESLPHYEAIRYWAVHSIIILGALYGTVVLGWKITWKDALRSVIGLNLLAAVMYPLNVALGANYMYLNAKPPGTTFYDLLGPWPYYILVIEVIVNVLFYLMVIPFYRKEIKTFFASKFAS